MTIFLVILSTVLVSLLSLIGVFTLSLKDYILNKIVKILVNLSIGVLLGVAFLDLIPESAKKYGINNNIFLYVIIGFFLFFLIEKLFHWRHCHEGDCPVHSFAYINLLGDAVHNFTDGMIIGASFVSGFGLGFASVLAVIFHEIPHEIGNFGVLIFAGFKKTRALFFNFITALTAVLGGIIGVYLSSHISNFISFLLPFAAGGFIYIAASDLIPATKEEENLRKSLLNFLIALIGFLLIFFLIKIMPE